MRFKVRRDFIVGLGFNVLRFSRINDIGNIMVGRDSVCSFW